MYKNNVNVQKCLEKIGNKFNQQFIPAKSESLFTSNIHLRKRQICFPILRFSVSPPSVGI